MQSQLFQFDFIYTKCFPFFNFPFMLCTCDLWRGWIEKKLCKRKQVVRAFLCGRPLHLTCMTIKSFYSIQCATVAVVVVVRIVCAFYANYMATAGERAGWCATRNYCLNMLRSFLFPNAPFLGLNKWGVWRVIQYAKAIPLSSNVKYSFTNAFTCVWLCVCVVYKICVTYFSKRLKNQ